MSFTDTKVWTTSPVSKVREVELIITRSHSTDLKVAETFAHHDENTKLWLYRCITFHLKFTKYRVAIVREKSGKNENFSKSGNFLNSQGKSLILSKSVKSQGILFSGLYFISFLEDFELYFLLEKTKSMLQSKQSNQFDTLRLTHVVVLVSGFHCGFFLPNSFFFFLRKAERGWKWRENCLSCCTRWF